MTNSGLSTQAFIISFLKQRLISYSALTTIIILVFIAMTKQIAKHSIKLASIVHAFSSHMGVVNDNLQVCNPPSICSLINIHLNLHNDLLFIIVSSYLPCPA